MFSNDPPLRFNTKTKENSYLAVLSYSVLPSLFFLVSELTLLGNQSKLIIVRLFVGQKSWISAFIHLLCVEIKMLQPLARRKPNVNGSKTQMIQHIYIILSANLTRSYHFFKLTTKHGWQVLIFLGV